jgi:2',5'-phosphodiesterase
MKVYAIKRRQGSLPLAICVGDAADVERYGACAHLPAGLLNDLLPGPVTVLLMRRGDAPLSALLNPGVATVGELPAIPCLCGCC